jgi:CO dehydrogenase nickel-insertion accessory protein CooC1
MKLQQANRKNVKIKMGLQGSSGSGKSQASLLIAYGITSDWGKVAVIDTENHSSELYSHLGNYNVLNLQPPFSPERYIEAINICEKAGI